MMKNIEQSSDIDSVLTGILNRYAASSKEKGIDAFMYEALSESSAYNNNEEIYNVISKVSKTIEDIRNGHLEIQDYKRRGLSSAIWLRDTIDHATTPFSSDEKKGLIVSLKQVLSQGNERLVSMLAPGEMHAPIGTALMSDDYSDINKTGIAQNIAKEIQINTLLGTVSFDGVTPPPTSLDMEIQVVKDYFEAPLDTQSDEDFKKVVSIGFELAREYDLLPESMSRYSTTELTTIVDKGISTAKVSYKVAKGEMDVTESIDYLIDHATATFGAMIKRGCEKFGGTAGAMLGQSLGKLGERFLGPGAAVIGAKIGRNIGKYAGRIVGEVLEKGVQILSGAAKKATHALIDGAKRVGNALKEKFSSAWDALTSIF